MIYPKHIAIIPDGNRTWAKERGKSSLEGHMAGVNTTVELVKYIFSNTDIKVFTGRGLSTENLHNRAKEELDYLFEIYKIAGNLLDDYMWENKINFRRVGNPYGMPEGFVQYLLDKQTKFSFGTDKYVCFAINYGGRDEIIRGIQKRKQSGNENLSEEEFSKYLDFGDLPPVELVIRTKGDEAQRLSGFMLWRVGYAQLYFSEKKFPDFDENEINKALEWFDKMADKRNFGK